MVQGTGPGAGDGEVKVCCGASFLAWRWRVGFLQVARNFFSMRENLEF